MIKPLKHWREGCVGEGKNARRHMDGHVGRRLPNEPEEIQCLLSGRHVVPLYRYDFISRT